MGGNLVIINLSDPSQVLKKEIEPIRDISNTLEKKNATYTLFKKIGQENHFYSSHTDGSVRHWEFNGSELNCKKIYPC